MSHVAARTGSLRHPGVALDLPRARIILGDLDSTFEPADVQRLHGGSTDVYRIDLAGDAPPLVLKLYPDGAPHGPAKEALVARWIADGADTPIPQWLKIDESLTVLPLRFAVMTFLPGSNLRAWRSSPDVGLLYRGMGETLRRLHAISMPAYGYVEDEGIRSPHATNASYMEQAFDQAFRNFRERGGDRDLSRRLEAFVHERFEVLAWSPRPVLCHDDFHQGNNLANRDADGLPMLTGVIDFGNALAGDPLSDLAKTLFCAGHEDPNSVEPIRAGYGAVNHPAAPEALRLYTLYHRLTMWTWLTRLGMTPASEACLGLLSDLEGSVNSAAAGLKTPLRRPQGPAR